jgi:hypothetical protein
VREEWAAYDVRPPPRLLTVAEPAADPLSEAELSRLWQGQRFPAAALRTPDGQAVEVVFPGHKGGASGPDFRDAVVRLAGRERRGDVELHVRASYWRSHGHDTDPAYDGVVLHVVYEADEGPLTLLSNGAVTPVAALAPWLAQRGAELRRWLEGPALWQEPCQNAVERLGEDEVTAALMAEGRRRFEVKVAALRAECERLGAEEALWRALVDALGYGGDRAAFRELGTRFPAALAKQIVAASVPSAIWQSGNLASPDTGSLKERRALLAASLKTVAGLAFAPEEMAAFLPAPLPVPPHSSGRPAGRPERRLEALAALFVRAGAELPGYAARTVSASAKVADLVTAWQVEGLGRERAAEIVLNVVLPFAAGRPALRERALSLAAALPAQRPYGKTAFLEANLRRAGTRNREPGTGAGANPGRLVRRALEQQGLLSLLSDWCSQGGCGHCPLS